MVQLWPGIPPEVLCDMYLNSCLNEGLNLLIRHHMAKGHRIDGWIETGCISVIGVWGRMVELTDEMKHRGKIWNYELTDSDFRIWEKYYDISIRGVILSFNEDAIKANPAKLAAKCRACRYRQTRCKGKETCEERLKARGMI